MIEPAGKSWNIGMKILRYFVIDKILGQGGMGSVYRVRSTHSHSHCLAMKTLQASYLDSPERKRMFIRELRTWIDLPDHPNITRCLFFRTVEDRIAIFSEFIDGGSIEEWIHTQRISSVDMLLKIAIGIARGLATAHSVGVIHRDIKPANILMTRDGVPKITDFGLSRATHLRKLKGDSRRKGAALVTTDGMTLAFCSPEQAAGSTLNHQTDIWSIGLTLLNIITGEITWPIGAMAPLFFQSLINSPGSRAPIAFPEPLVEILNRCFEKDLDRRWATVSVLADALESLLKDLTGTKYSPGFKPDTFPEHQLSGHLHRRTIRGGFWKDPLEWLNYARKAVGKESVTEVNVSEQQPVSVKARALEDVEVLEESHEILSDLAAQGFDSHESVRAKILFEKGKILEFIEDIPGALVEFDAALNILKSLSQPLPLKEIVNLATLQIQKANLLLSQRDDALTLYDATRDLLLNSEDPSHPDIQDLIARVHANTGNVHWSDGRVEQAAKCYRQATDIWETLARTYTSIEYREELARIYPNQAIMKCIMGHGEEALNIFDRAIEMTETLIQEKSLDHLKRDLGNVFLNKAMALHEMNRINDALELIDRSITCYEDLLYRDGQNRVLEDLVGAEQYRCSILTAMNRTEDALVSMEKARQIMDHLVSWDGREDLLGDQGILLAENATLCLDIHQLPEAVSLKETAVRLMKTDLAKTHRHDVEEALNILEIKFQNIPGTEDPHK